MNPVGPLISTGDVSAIYFGQNKLNDPHANPYTNLPAMSTTRDVTLSLICSATMQMQDPSITNILDIRMHFHLPYFANGPANNAPIAHPPVWNDWTNV